MALTPVSSSLLGAGLSLVFASNAHAFGWHHGVGIGINHVSSDAKIGFYDDKQSVAFELDEQFKPEKSSDWINNLAAIEGYSTNHTWLLNYSLSQYSTRAEPDQISQAKLTGSQANILIGHRLFEFNQNIRLYGLAGGQYKKQKFSYRSEGVNTIKLTKSKFKPVAGLQLDIPLHKYLVGHLKTQTAISSDSTDTQTSLGLNLRVSRNMSLIAEYKISQFELENQQPEQAGYYHFDGDLNQVSLRAIFIW